MFLDRSQFEPAPGDGLEPPEKTGLKRFLEIIQTEFLSLIKLNLLFLILCLPVVTLPAALFAAHRAARKMVLGTFGACWPECKAAFRPGWKRAYGAFFLTALPLGVGGYGASFYLGHARQSLLLIVPFAFCTLVCLITALASPYLYGLLADGRPFRASVRTALLLGIARPLRGALAALCWYGLPALALALFPLSGAYLALIGFSFPFLLGAFYTRTVLRQFCGTPAEPSPRGPAQDGT